MHIDPTSSATVLDFKMDFASFVIGCSNSSGEDPCSSHFESYLEPFRACFKGKRQHVLSKWYAEESFLFYFDPELNLGKYTESFGATVKVSRTSNDVSLYSIPVSPGESVSVFVKPRSKFQERSYKSLKCRSGQTNTQYSFTGQPFELEYSVESCMLMCFWQELYRHCNCAPVFGWNFTNSGCLEDQEKRKCIKRVETTSSGSQTLDSEKIQNCRSNCLPLCNEKGYDISVSRKSKFPPIPFLYEALRTYQDKGVDTPLIEFLLSQIQSGNGSVVAQNVAQLNVVEMKNSLESVTEIQLVMTLSALYGNLGGVIGVWAGWSVISAFEFFEKVFTAVVAFRSENKKYETAANESGELDVTNRRNGKDQGGVRESVKNQHCASPDDVNTCEMALLSDNRFDAKLEFAHRIDV